MKTKMRLVALLLAVIMILSACGTPSANVEETKGNDVVENVGVDSAETSKYPEYLNLDSAWPVIKDEYAGTIKLKVMIGQGSNVEAWEDTWICQYLKGKYNIEFEVESVNWEAMEERKSLAFNSADLPDIMINMNVSTTDLYRYGVEEGLLLQMDQYINEDLTPDLLRYLNSDNKQIRANVTTPDGHIYSMPWVYSVEDAGIFQKVFINKAWLDQLGLEMPRTLDEFTAAMYAMKEADISGVGSENLYPLGQGMDGSVYYLLNALGYNTYDGYGASPAIRDGEVVIPAYDVEVFKEYVALMNQYYKDGIIAPNFFQLEYTENVGKLTAGQSAVYNSPVYLVGVQSWDEWYACYPLTSDYQAEPDWPTPNVVNVGNFVVSADTEYPELCMMIANLAYNNSTDYNRSLWLGTPEEEYAYGFPQRYVNEQGVLTWPELPNGMDSWTWLTTTFVGFQPNWGTIELPESSDKHNELYTGLAPKEDPTVERAIELNNGDMHYRATVESNVMPYAGDSFPGVYYVDAETQELITDYWTVIVPYIKEQVALFVVGDRSLDEIDKFASELESMNIGVYLEAFENIYSTYIGE